MYRSSRLLLCTTQSLFRRRQSYCYHNCLSRLTKVLRGGVQLVKEFSHLSDSGGNSSGRHGSATANDSLQSGVSQSKEDPVLLDSKRHHIAQTLSDYIESLDVTDKRFRANSTVDSTRIKQTLNHLLQIVNKSDIAEKYSLSKFAKVLQGIGHISANEFDVKNLLLIKLFSRLDMSSPDQLAVKHIADCFEGFQFFPWTDSEYKVIVSLCRWWLQLISSKSSLMAVDGDALAKSFQLLQPLKSSAVIDADEAASAYDLELILAALAQPLRCNQQLNASQIASILYCLRNIHTVCNMQSKAFEELRRAMIQQLQDLGSRSQGRGSTSSLLFSSSDYLLAIQGIHFLLEPANQLYNRQSNRDNNLCNSDSNKSNNRNSNVRISRSNAVADLYLFSIINRTTKSATANRNALMLNISDLELCCSAINSIQFYSIHFQMFYLKQLLSAVKLKNAVADIQRLVHSMRQTSMSEHLQSQLRNCYWEIIASCCDGLKHISNKIPNADELFKIFNTYLVTSFDLFSSESIDREQAVRLISVLKSASNDSLEIKELIMTINTLLVSKLMPNCLTESDIIQIVSCCKGLDNSDEVIKLFDILLRNTVIRGKQSFAQSVSLNEQLPKDFQYLIGLQKMSFHKSPQIFMKLLPILLSPVQINKLLAALPSNRPTRLLRSSQSPSSLTSSSLTWFDGYNISALLFGLQGMNYDTMTGPYLKYCIQMGYEYTSLANIRLSSSRSEDAGVYVDHNNVVVKHLAKESIISPLLLGYYALASQKRSTIPQQHQHMLAVVIRRLAVIACDLQHTRVAKGLSKKEIAFCSIVQSAVDELGYGMSTTKAGMAPAMPRILVVGGQMLFGFEADITLQFIDWKGGRASLSDRVWDKSNEIEKHKVINIEIDGPFHKLPRTEMLCRLRDKYLAEVHNVDVVRFDLLDKSVSTLNTTNLKHQIIQLIQSVKQ